MKRTIAAALVLTTVAIATVALSQSFKSSPRIAVEFGMQKGPTQPIAYSHELHAGTLQMDCKYCHFSTTKSAWANIPPVSTCMGCHTYVATDKPEVQKLAGYFERGEQVPWVRVHNMPDHVKFNHKRHVRAGVECQTCHGPIQAMPVVYQYSSLKMGWCIECHRSRLDDPTHPTSMDCLICHH